MAGQGVASVHAVLSDEQVLLQRLRDGENAAFSELFELHSTAVRRFSASLASDSSEAEDITAETFFRVLQALRRGAGPRDHIRAYLLTVARRVSWEWHGAKRDVPVTDDELTTRAGASADAVARSTEHSLITSAFSSLPERWRTVLWQTEVEGEQPAVVGPRYGLSPNATAALARRARLGLRAAYLQAHLASRVSEVGCRSVREKLGGYTAGSVTGTESRKIRMHLRSCSSCRTMHAELRDVCFSLRDHAGVLVFLLPASSLALGAASAGASSTSSGLAATVKSFLLGSKAKVGIALTSAAAAGVFGVGVGPMVLDSEHAQQISLPGQGAVELVIAAPEPPKPVEAPGSKASEIAPVVKAPVVKAPVVPNKAPVTSGTNKKKPKTAETKPASKAKPVAPPAVNPATSASNPSNWRIDRPDTVTKPATPTKPSRDKPSTRPGHGKWQLKPGWIIGKDGLPAWLEHHCSHFKRGR